MGNDASLKREVESCLKEAAVPDGTGLVEARGVIVPHAGYEYSGAVACAVYARVEIPGALVILGPNHTGLGEPLGVQTDGTWSTPFGDVEVDGKLASAILKGSRVLKADTQCHAYEHSIEVQVPFLQHFAKHRFGFVPISMREYDLADCKDIGASIAKAIGEGERQVLVVASTDFTHYEPQAEAESKDKLAIEAIRSMDPRTLFDVVVEHEISMCGVGPVAATMYACRELGAMRAQLVKYETSGARTGDYGAVVGYAGIIVR